MTPERWEKIVDLAEAATELGIEEREAFLDKACAGDDAMRCEVESLLASDQQAESFIEAPAFRTAAELIAEDLDGSMIDQEVGLFKIVGSLGAGAMGEVYLALDTRLGRKVALKFLPSHFTNDKARVRRFEREARAASTLNHPNIIIVYKIDQSCGLHFIATEFVEGETLRQHLKSRRLTVAEALDVAIQAASALEAAHQAGVVHRDIKPDNIMVRPDGLIKILDFGLAKIFDQRHETPESSGSIEPKSSTQTGAVLGTPYYMSPEQARGLNVDGRTDIFSLGVVIYEMLTGRKPFEGETPSHVVVAILEKDPPPISESSPGISTDLENVVSRTLEKDAQARYQTARELIENLRRIRDELDNQALSAHDRNAEASGLSEPSREKIANKTRSSGAIRPNETTGIAPAARSISRHPIRMALGALALVAAAGAATYFSGSKNGNAINSLAILPFETAGTDSNVEYLSEGIPDYLINSLSRLPSLMVISRSAASRYKARDPRDRGPDPRTIGRQLGVRAVVVGKVVQQGDRIHISVELVDVQTNRHLWGEEYERKLTDILSMQEDIARSVSASLRLRLTDQQQNRLARRYTESPEAYIAYMRGRYYWNKRNEEGTRKAIDQFRQAIDLDPTYALAYAGLADTYAILGTARYNPLPPEAEMLKAREAASRALEIDETLAEAHSAMAFILGWYDWNWASAERELKRAIELQPRYSTAHQRYAWYFMAMGRLDEALAEMKLAQDCDALSLIIGTNVGTVLYCRRQYDEALAQFQRVAELDPNFYMSHAWPGMAYLEKGAFSEAIAEFRQEKVPWEESVWLLGVTYARLGQRDAARKILDRLEKLAKERYISPYAFILIHAALGEKDQAFAWLDRASEAREFDLCLLKVDPKLDSLRADPRFARVLQRVGLDG
jgi:serine/threonine-protein kinase